MTEEYFGLMRLPQVLNMLPVSKATWWAGVKSGKYPASIKSGRMTFWKKADVIALCKKIEAENK